MIHSFKFFKKQDIKIKTLTQYLIAKWKLTQNGKVPNHGENDDGETESDVSEDDDNYSPSHSDSDEDDNSGDDSSGLSTNYTMAIC